MNEDSDTLRGIHSQIEGLSGIVYTEQDKMEQLAQSLTFKVCENKQIFQLFMQWCLDNQSNLAYPRAVETILQKFQSLI